MVATADGPDGFARLYDEEFDRIARTVYLVLRNSARAEEVTQEAFVRLYVRWARVSRYDRPGAWVRRVAIRLATRDASRELRRPALERLSPPARPPDPRDLDLLDALAGLPVRQRAAIVLHYFEDLPVAEVADALGMSLSAAKVTLHRGRRSLAVRLDEEVSDVR